MGVESLKGTETHIKICFELNLGGEANWIQGGVKFGGDAIVHLWGVQRRVGDKGRRGVEDL